MGGTTRDGRGRGPWPRASKRRPGCLERTSALIHGSGGSQPKAGLVSIESDAGEATLEAWTRAGPQAPFQQDNFFL